ncbi:MAG: VWA domain-containing protein [Pseudomonadota bacterium]
MSKKSGQLSHKNTLQAVSDFLDKVDSLPQSHDGGRAGKLVFAMDATASRSGTWDMACKLQGDMFAKSSAVGSLELQLVFFRGYDECKSTRWLSNPMDLLRLMSKVSCLAGQTQIERVLKHTIAEAKAGQVDALVYVGDSMEEKLDTLGALAGELKIHGVPMFIFQEGHDVVASGAFVQLAAVSGGAHCTLDHNSPAQLGQLLNAAAVYAAGGRSALKEHARLTGGMANKLIKQLK